MAHVWETLIYIKIQRDNYYVYYISLITCFQFISVLNIQINSDQNHNNVDIF